MRVLLLALAALAAPAYGDELLYTLSGSFEPVGDPPPSLGSGQSFSGSFILDTGSASSNFNFQGGQVHDWTFQDATVTDLVLELNGQAVVNMPTLTVSGGGTGLGPTSLINFMSMGSAFNWDEFDSSDPKSVAGADALATFLTEISYGGSFGLVDNGQYLVDFGTQVQRIGVPEPGTLGLAALGLGLLLWRRPRPRRRA